MKTKVPAVRRAKTPEAVLRSINRGSGRGGDQYTPPRLCVWRLPLHVAAIPNKDTHPFLLEIHYARRLPSISFAFGLFDGDVLIGVCTYGSPPAPALKRGIFGPDFPYGFLELNRLCLLHNRKNEASFLVARSMRLLPKPTAVISFADLWQGHRGVVYQATNAKYLGLSAKRTDWALKSEPKIHAKTLGDRFKGPDSAKRVREHYGDDFYLRPRPRKHRYLWLLGRKKEVRDMSARMIVPTLPYPQIPEWMK